MTPMDGEPGVNKEREQAANLFLKKKYDLHKAPEVTAAALRTEGRTGEKLPQSPTFRIQNYLDRFHEITDRENRKDRECGITAMKRLLYRKYVIKADEIPESYWENQRRILRERGQGADLEYVDWEEIKRQNSEAIIADQRSSLDTWIDYLSSRDAPYSDGLKYFTLRNVLGMGEYDKEKKAFTTRSKGTTKPFPDLNREALAYVLDLMDKKVSGQPIDISAVDPKEIESFKQAVRDGNFPKLYAWAIQEVTPADAESLASTQGQWVKYDKGSDHMPLVQSLKGHGTGWCTAGESTAKIQLRGGDFYVYYSNDSDKKPTVPRVAIRMEKGSIAEVRGIAEEQNLDPYIAPVVEEKLEEFPDGNEYQKKVADMKKLTEIEYKTRIGEQLDGSDLTFLYEIDGTIQGFGYEKDPRIKELRAQRNSEEDMPTVFGCEASQIAHTITEITTDTKAYVGQLTPGIFDALASNTVEYIYTTFPEGRIERQSVEIGGKTKEQLLHELEKAGVSITFYAEDIMNSSDFTTLPTAQTVETVRLKIEDIDIDDYSTTDQVYKKVQELGLTVCPPELGLKYRLQYKDQPIGEAIWIGMRQIVDSSGDPQIFNLAHSEEGIWLNGDWAWSDTVWNPEDEFVFCLLKGAETGDNLPTTKSEDLG